jgi:hypothetical protein
MANATNAEKRRKVLAGIMAGAHWNTRWKKTSGDKRSYAVIFAEQLTLSWARLKQAEEAKHNAALRQKLRNEQNLNLPIASCAFDMKRRSFMRPSRLAAVGE